MIDIVVNKALTDTVIELSVPNFDITKSFYQKLGFNIAWEEPANKMNGYLVMKRKDSIICFFCGNDYVYSHPYFKNFPHNTKRGYGVEISIPVEDIDKVYETVKSQIPQKHIYQELQEQPWGKKDFRVEDPFGYFLRFNEPWNVLEYIPLEEDYK